MIVMASKKKKKNDDREAVEVPPWLVVMCDTIFFVSCNYHRSNKRNDLDRFCIDCANTICYNCIISHHQQLHTHFKIRRYIYSDVIIKQDLSKFFNCHGIQVYHTNKAKVIFLKQRPAQQKQQQQQQQLQPFYTRDYSCTICDKSLQDNSLYCSIACKIADIHRNDVNKESVAADSVDDHCSNKKAENGNKIKDLHKPCKKPRRRKGFPIRAPFF